MTTYHFEDFKYLGKDGVFDIFQVTEVETKHHWFRAESITKKKLLLQSVPSINKYDNISKKYKNISFFSTSRFLTDRCEYDKVLKQFLYRCILFNELDKQ